MDLQLTLSEMAPLMADLERAIQNKSVQTFLLKDTSDQWSVMLSRPDAEAFLSRLEQFFAEQAN